MKKLKKILASERLHQASHFKKGRTPFEKLMEKEMSRLLRGVIPASAEVGFDNSQTQAQLHIRWGNHDVEMNKYLEWDPTTNSFKSAAHEKVLLGTLRAFFKRQIHVQKPRLPYQDGGEIVLWFLL